MKKHDEGYVMLLVVVVILVLSIVSAALMSMTVTNLKNQRNSVDRMQEKYSAQGELEKVVAQLESKIPAEEKTVEITSLNKTPEECLSEAVKSWLEGIKNDTGFEESQFIDLSLPETEGTFSCKILLSAETENTQISTELKLTGTVVEKDPEPTTPSGESTDPSESTEDGKTTYIITFNKLTYTSYEITEKEVAG